MTSIASWQVAHPAPNTSIFRFAAIFLIPIYLGALRRRNDSRQPRWSTLPLGVTSEVKSDRGLEAAARQLSSSVLLFRRGRRVSAVCQAPPVTIGSPAARHSGRPSSNPRTLKPPAPSPGPASQD